MHTIKPLSAMTDAELLAARDHWLSRDNQDAAWERSTALVLANQCDVEIMRRKEK